MGFARHRRPSRSIAHVWPALLGLLVGLGACSGDKKKKSGGDETPTTAKAENSTENAGPAGDPCAKAEPKHGQMWIVNDYPSALACARKLDKPLFLDLWAPWCHTCISMQEYIFPDPGLEPMKDRFVWAALNTDKEVNAAVQESFPPEVWPTFYIVSPHDQSMHGRYLGAAPVDQFRDYLLAGERSYNATRTGDLPADSPLRLLVEADRASTADDFEVAKEKYLAALAKAPDDWAPRSSSLVSLARVMVASQDWDACLDVAENSLDQLDKSANTTDFIYRINMCAGQVEEERGKAMRERMLAKLTALVDDETAKLSYDDRSDGMAILRSIYLALDRKEEADAMAERQLALLEKAAEAAPNPWVAMTYNWPRSEVHVYLERGLELIPVLEKSTADLPNEYDPPYRMAWVYLKSGEPEKALEPGLKAASLAYGPRKGRVLTVIADIYKALGDTENERKTRQAVLDLYTNLPPGQRSEAKIELAKEQLAAMDAPEGDKPE